jgi:hypothetical protein
LEREAAGRSNNSEANKHRRRKVAELRDDIAALERLRDQTQQQFAVATAEGEEAMRLWIAHGAGSIGCTSSVGSTY